MARVAVRRDDYEDGVFPPVCVHDGGPAEMIVRHHSRAGAGPWVLLLLFLGPIGIVVILVVDRMLDVQASGRLPSSRAAMDAMAAARRRWYQMAAFGGIAFAGGVALAFTTIGNPRGLGLGLVLIGLVLGVIGLVAPGLLGVSGRPDRAGRTVTLTGVSPEFVDAYRLQDARRAAARREQAWHAAAPAGRPAHAPR